MKFKISLNKIIILETCLIGLLILILYLLCLNRVKNKDFTIVNTKLIDDEETKVVQIFPRNSKDDNYVEMYFNNENEIFGVDFINSDYIVNYQILEDNWLYSSVVCAGFDEMSYIMPFNHGEIKDRDLRPIVVGKSFRYKSDKSIDFVIDCDGKAQIIE